jgi:hypothetical protein
VFGRLAVGELARAALVCRSWWAVSLEGSLWHSLYQVHLPPMPPWRARQAANRPHWAPGRKESPKVGKDCLLQHLRSGRCTMLPAPCQGKCCLTTATPMRGSWLSRWCQSIRSKDVEWKERYRKTFHFRKRTLLSPGDRKKNEIVVCLDTSYFVAGEPSLELTGEVRGFLNPKEDAEELLTSPFRVLTGHAQCGVNQPHHTRHLHPVRSLRETLCPRREGGWAKTVAGFLHTELLC